MKVSGVVGLGGRVARIFLALGLAMPLAWSATTVQTQGAPPAATPPAIRVAESSGVSVAAGQAFFASATTHTFEADEAAVHPLIASAARRLQNDPDRIYEFVRNTVDVEPTFGLQKGAVGTLTHRSGTPFDQADLMVKLLRAAGYSSARFRFGPANLTAQQCLEWLGTNDAAAVRRILNDGGFPADVAGTTTVTSASFLTAWVEVQIGGTWYQFDPAFKTHDWHVPADFKTLMGYNRTTVRSAAGSFTATGAVPQVSASSGTLETTLTGYASTLSTALSGATYSQKSSEEVLGGRRIQQVTRTSQRLTALPHAPLGTSTTFAEVPDLMRTKITVIGYPTSGAATTIVKYGDSHYADLYRMYSSQYAAVPPNFLWLNIPPWGANCNSCGAETLPFDTIAVTVNHPYAASSGAYGDQTYATRTADSRPAAVSGQSGAQRLALRGIWLSLGRDTDRGFELYQRQAAKNIYCQPGSGWIAPGYCNFTAQSDPALVNTAKAARLAEGIGNARIANHHAVLFSYFTGAVHDWTSQQWSAPYNQNYTYEAGEATLLSIQSQVSVAPRSGLAADRSAAIGAHAAMFQAAESIGMAQSVQRTTPHDVWDAYAATGGANRFVWIHSGNYSSAIGQLTGYTGLGSLKLTRLQEYVNAGYTVLAPKSGAIGPSLLTDLKSVAFWVVSPTGNMAAVYVEPGDKYIVVKGAAGSRPRSDAKPVGLSNQMMDEYNRGVFDPSGAISVDQQSGLASFAPPTLLSTGSGDFPRRLDFNIKISGEPTNNPMIGYNVQTSPRLQGNAGFMYAPTLGATTVYSSLEHDLSLGEDLGLMFGERAPVEAAQAITTAVVSMEEIKAGPDALSGLVFMQAQTWLGKQFADGVATVVHGVDGIGKFVRKPDGAWRAPPDSLETLTQTGAPSYIPPFNRRGYKGVTFLWRASDGATKSFRQPTPGTANDSTPSSGSQLTSCMGVNTASNMEVEKAYWGINKGFGLDYWTMPGGEWVKGEYSDSTCGVITLTGLKNNYGRSISFGAAPTAGAESTTYVTDDTGRTVEMLNMPMFTAFAPDSTQPSFSLYLTSTSSVYDLGFKLPDGQKLWVEADQCAMAYKTQYSLGRQYCNRLKMFFNDPVNPLQTVNMDVDDPAVASMDDGDGVTTTFATMPGYRFASTDEAGGTSSTIYDTAGQTIESLSAGGRLKTYAYDGRGRVTAEKLALASAPTILYGHTTYAYDLDGRKTETRVKTGTDPATGLPYAGADIVTQTVWNTTWNKPAIQYDARQKATTYTYSATNGLLTQVDGPSGERTITEYDALGRTYRTKVLVQTSPTLVERVTQFGYDAKGNLTTTTVDPLGTPLVTTLGYDTVGNMTSVLNPRGYSTTATYDVLRRMTQVDGAAGSQVVMLYGGNGNLYRVEQKTSDPLKPAVTTWEYLPSGRVRTTTDPESKTTVYTYNSVGQMRYIDDPVGRRTEYGYTADGDVSFVTSGVGTTTASTISMVYHPDGGVRFQRDGLYGQTGQEFGTVENLRDAWGRPAGIKYGAGGQYETVVRDPAGNITSVRVRDASPANGGTDRYITFTYDDSGRVSMKTAPTTTATKNLVTTNTYSLAGELLTATFFDDRVPATTQRLAYEYEAPTGRLKSETWWERYGVTTGFKTGYEYDPAGNRSAIIWPDLYRATYSYDSEDRMTTVGYVRPGGASGTFLTYAPNPQGTIDAISYGNGATATISRLSAGAVRQISFNFGSGGAPSFAYGYSNALQAAYEHVTDAVYAWKPVAPNATHAFNAVTQVGQATNLYNQYEQATVTTGSAPVTVNYAHDPRGNMTANGTLIYAYDYENRMERVTTNGGVEVVRYDYDPAGRRSIKALTTGAKTAFAHAGYAEIADIDAVTSTILRRYIPGDGIDEWAAYVDEQASGAIKYVHQNRIGSVIALSDIYKQIASNDRFTYDPYGVSPSPTTGFPFRYTGQRVDPETGLYYFRARYYDPRIGRLMQRDPIGVAGGLNQYSYVLGDPLNMTDPSGTDACDVVREDGSVVRLPGCEDGSEDDPSKTASAPTSEDTVVEAVVVTAATTKKFSTGQLIALGATNKEPGFFVSELGIWPATVSDQKEVTCSDGSKRLKGKINRPPAGQRAGHGHPKGRREPGVAGAGGARPSVFRFPGPEDGVLAAQTGGVSYQIAFDGSSFAIESTPVGFRVRQLSGSPLTGSERRALQGQIDAWDNNGGGDGKKCR